MAWGLCCEGRLVEKFNLLIVVSPNNISNFENGVGNGFANSINTTSKGHNDTQTSLKPYGVQSVEPLFYSNTLTLY